MCVCNISEDTICLTVSAALCRSMTLLWILISNLHQKHRDHTLTTHTLHTLIHIQWNLSNPDTNESVIVSEASSFQRLKCMQEWYILGVGKGALFREVSSVQECPHRERERERHTHTHSHSHLSQVLEPSPQGVLRQVILSVLVGILIGPLTFSSDSLDLFIRSLQTIHTHKQTNKHKLCTHKLYVHPHIQNMKALQSAKPSAEFICSQQQQLRTYTSVVYIYTAHARTSASLPRVGFRLYLACFTPVAPVASL